MRDAVVDRKLEHFRVDQDELAGVGRLAVEQRQDHRVDRHGLARSGGAGDQQVRHAGEIDEDRSAADVLAERQRQGAARALQSIGSEQLAQSHRFAALVRQFDADDVATGNDGDPRRDGAHRASDVVGESDDACALRSGGGLQLVEGDHRAGAYLDDFAANTEVVENGLEHTRVLLEGATVHRFAEDLRRGRMEQIERRQPILRRSLEVESALRRLSRLAAGSRARRLGVYQIAVPGARGPRLAGARDLAQLFLEPVTGATGECAESHGRGAHAEAAVADRPSEESPIGDGDAHSPPERADAGDAGEHGDGDVRQHWQMKRRGGDASRQHGSDRAAETGGDRPAGDRRHCRQGQTEKNHGEAERQALRQKPAHRSLADRPPRPAEQAEHRNEGGATETVQQQVGGAGAGPAEKIGRLCRGRVVERRIARIEAGERQKQRQAGAEQDEPAQLRRSLLQVVDGPQGQDRECPGADHVRARQAVKDTPL